VAGGRPLEIGYNVSTSAADGADPLEDAGEVEEMGFDFVSLSDHLHGDHPTFETWTLLTWIAAGTSRVRVLTNVLGLPYRPAPVVAKMAESLDRLTGGRLVLGLGAGGADAEFTAFGLDPGAAGAKVAALDEAITATRALWERPGVELEGEHVRLRKATITPRAARPIPIWVGAYGPRMLDLVGRAADGWLPSMPFAPPERMPSLRDRVRRAAEAAGRDPDAITYAYNVGVHVGRRQEDRPLVSGSALEVAFRLRSLVDELGLDAVNLWPSGDEQRQREALAEVLSALRAG
jgi:alkanesulfonate monooxygenase SsuD/methylene tetrahydromethanopterin reductase-like flavin-dependent oxidoreductase (luciferase family)